MCLSVCLSAHTSVPGLTSTVHRPLWTSENLMIDDLGQCDQGQNQGQMLNLAIYRSIIRSSGQIVFKQGSYIKVAERTSQCEV